MTGLRVFICFLALCALLVAQSQVPAGTGTGCGKGCNNRGGQEKHQVLDAETKKKYEAFLQDTIELRKELDEKLIKYRTLMSSDNPDPAKAALLTQQYYQLRDFIMDKAVQAGIVQRKQGCNGCNGTACGLAAADSNKQKTSE